MTEGHTRQSHEHRKDLAGEYRWGDTVQMVLLFIFMIGMCADVFVVRLGAPLQNSIPWYFRLVPFSIIFFSAGYFAQRAHKKVFAEERDKIMLINTDVFARLRHPMYFGSLLLYLSFVILSLSVISLVIFIVIVFVYYCLCRYEEKLLLEKLGEVYQTYMNNVPMLIPKLWKY